MIYVLCFCCSNAPWMRLDDTRVSRASWKNIRDDTRTSISDTAYMFFYRRLSSAERARAAARSAAPPSTISTPSTPTAQISPLLPLTSLQRSSSALSACPSLLASGRALEWSMSPSLPELVCYDNTQFVKELSSNVTVNYHLQLNSVIRQEASFYAPFHLALQPSPSTTLPSNPTIAAGSNTPPVATAVGATVAKVGVAAASVTPIPTPSAPATTVASSPPVALSMDMLCSACLAPRSSHVSGSAINEACTLSSYAVVECPHCGLRSSRAVYDQHLVDSQRFITTPSSLGGGALPPTLTPTAITGTGSRLICPNEAWHERERTAEREKEVLRLERKQSEDARLRRVADAARNAAAAAGVTPLTTSGGVPSPTSSSVSNTGVDTSSSPVPGAAGAKSATPTQSSSNLSSSGNNQGSPSPSTTTSGGGAGGERAAPKLPQGAIAAVLAAVAATNAAMLSSNQSVAAASSSSSASISSPSPSPPPLVTSASGSTSSASSNVPAAPSDGPPSLERSGSIYRCERCAAIFYEAMAYFDHASAGDCQ
jgi:DNA-directed RNA polymerase subunit RPC12/RpoP